MFLHLGQGETINSENVVGIFDLDSVTVSKRGREYLNRAESEGKVITVSMELPKSFIVMENGRVYISQISASTLKKRLAGLDLQ